MVKIACIIVVSTPYFRCRFAAASRNPGIEIHSIEVGAASDTYAFTPDETAEGYNRHIVSPKPMEQQSHSDIICQLCKCLDRVKPDVVGLPGWLGTASFVAMRWCAANRIPAVMMSESTVWDEPRVAWKEWIKRRIVGAASAAFVGGTPHAAYMRQLGMPENRIFIGYDAVDNAYFAAEAEKWKCGEILKAETVKSKTRELAGKMSALPNSRPSSPNLQCSIFQSQPSTIQPPYFLASNRFIEKKNLFRLLEAYASYVQQSKINNQQSTIWPLCLLGDGELKGKLLARCAELNLGAVESAPWEHLGNAESRKSKADMNGSTVYFPGFRQIEELPRFYSHAGAFVHASTIEPWGLVVNEAMAAGLPVIVSNRVGCAQDLVQNDVNGFTFDPCDVEQLAQLMIKVSNPCFPHAAFGHASCSIIAGWGPDRFASGLVSACEMAIQVGSGKSRMSDRLLLEALIYIR